jgi:DNA-binding CsgD family transcriptional regulator
MLHEDYPSHSPLGLLRLSPREAQVLEMASHGLTNAQMAVRLDVTVHAVKFHLASIYRKLEVANRTEAASIYLRHAGNGSTDARLDTGYGA